jgi:preprotein translocase subunit SecA
MVFNKVLNKVLRTGEGKTLRELKAISEEVNKLEPIYQDFDDADFPGLVDDLKKRYWGISYDQYVEFIEGKIDFIPVGDGTYEEIEGSGKPQSLRATTPIEPRGESLENLMSEAFAIVREASKRVLGMRHFDVQIMGGAALFKGNIAEMKTGEGKTLVATLPSFLGAISGLGVHVVTVNDYLAKYQSELMGRVFHFLGLSTGCVTTDQNVSQRKAGYDADITYGTNNQFGFDYLNDNLATDRSSVLQRAHNFAIVDEVDSILIDEARTPLIISGRAGGNKDATYTDFARFVTRLDRATNIDKSIPELLKKATGEAEAPNGDYEVDEKNKTVGVLDSAIDKLEEYLGIDNLYDPQNTHLVQFLQNAIRAKELFHLDKDYIVQNGEVKIVDEHTGRILEGRRFNEGLHQALEAKEGVKIKEENQTLATITLQNYFRLYTTLSGMTGTAETEAAEFASTYDLGVVPIPTNRPMIRVDQEDFLFKNLNGKYSAIVEDVKYRNEIGQPVLIGTISVEKSEEISHALKMAGIEHNVLNAKQHAREAAIVAMAGRKGAVTVATNMAGRGTDIMLGGNLDFLIEEELMPLKSELEALDAQLDSLQIEGGPGKGSDEYKSLEKEYLKKDREYNAQWIKTKEKVTAQVKAEHDEVSEIGGLYVLGTERHESRRIDNQLRGRSGRQGDPGESRFYISMEDDLMKLFNSQRAASVMDMINLPEDQPIENKMLSRTVRTAQAKVEARNFEIRKNVLKYDDVMTKQRKVMYAERNRVLQGENLGHFIEGFVQSVLSEKIFTATVEGAPEDWDLAGLWREIGQVFTPTITPDDIIESVGKIGSLSPDVITREVISDAMLRYAERVEFAGEANFRDFERNVVLGTLDQNWRQHLQAMDYLREGIGLRAMAQKDPLVEYTNEGSRMFQNMNHRIQEQTLSTLFKASIQKPGEGGKLSVMDHNSNVIVLQMSGPTEDGSSSSSNDSESTKSSKAGSNKGANAKVTRSTNVNSNQAKSAKKQAIEANQSGNNPFAGTPKNSLCPCGSGKKYKACHGLGE